MTQNETKIMILSVLCTAGVSWGINRATNKKRERLIRQRVERQIVKLISNDDRLMKNLRDYMKKTAIDLEFEKIIQNF